MADLPHRCHGNFPQRRAALLPQVARCGAHLAPEAVSSETGPDPAPAAEEPSLPADHLHSNGVCETDTETKPRAVCPSSSEQPPRQPDQSVAALLKTIKVHPEAQRILGNACLPVVILERLNFRSVSLSSLQPVVALVRLPCPAPIEPCSGVSSHRPRQNGFAQNEVEVSEIRGDSPESKPAEDSNLSQPTTTRSWTEPYCPDSSASEEPEQDSGFDCESNPDHTYILFDCGAEEWEPDGKTDSETFYLDPDPEQAVVIEVDPDVGRERSTPLEDDCDSKNEVDVVEMEDRDEPSADVRCPHEEEGEGDSSTRQPEPGAEAQEMESEDFCAVCLNGGDLLCCDRCPKVYHLACHVPPLISFPLGDWACTLCRSDQEPAEAYACERTRSCGGVKAPYTLSSRDQRRCEKLTLLLYCHLLSAPFHEPVSPLARNYYQIIKRPIDLSAVRRKLDESNTLHYFSAEQFVDDVLLMFKNCATFNYPDSEVAQAGRNLEVFFLSKLKEIFPERTFPSASQDRTDRARVRWLRRRRRENHRRKRCVFPGKKYYL